MYKVVASPGMRGSPGNSARRFELRQTFQAESQKEGQMLTVQWEEVAEPGVRWAKKTVSCKAMHWRRKRSKWQLR